MNLMKKLWYVCKFDTNLLMLVMTIRNFIVSNSHHASWLALLSPIVFSLLSLLMVLLSVLGF